MKSCRGDHSSRRTTVPWNWLVTVALATLTVTAGCGVILGQQPLEATASPATIPNETLAGVGYVELDRQSQTVSHEVSVGGQRREARVTNRLVEYGASTSAPGTAATAVLVTFTTPAVELGGRSLNPIAGVSTPAVLSRVDAGSVNVSRRIGTERVRSLGASRTLSKYAGTARVGATRVETFVHAAKFRHGADYVVVVAAYPQAASGEEKRVRTLFAGLEHEG